MSSDAKPKAKAGKEQEKIGSDFKVLFPGTHVEIETDTGKIGWTVFPVSFRKMREFSEGIGKALSVFGQVQITPGASFEEHMKQILPAMLPVVLEELLDLVEDCCLPDTPIELGIVDIPYYLAVPILEAWFNESFGSEAKVRPLVSALERAAKKITGKSVDLWGALSQLSSEQDIVEPTSLNDDSPDSPTEDGASPS